VMRYSREGVPYTPEMLPIDVQQVEKTYRDAGFLRVQLERPDVRNRTAGEESIVTIRLVVKEGPRYTAGKVAVKETEAIPAETLMQISPLQKNKPYSPEKALQWQAKVEDSFRSLGYVKAQCPLQETVNESSKTVDCTMECVEGKIYTVRNIQIAGGGDLNPLAVKKRLFFSEGGIYNPEMISLTIQYLNQSRMYEPISGSDVDIRFDDEKGVVDISLRVAPRAP
jgi:outer membrane protein assembly factor BamA